MEQIHKIADSTLAELRAIIAVTGDLPDDTVIRAKIGFGNLNGAKLKRLHLGAPRPTR